MPAASILIKPASSACNIDCKYCFYKKLVDKREIGNCGQMSLDTAEMLVRQAISYADDFLCFAFQGGEPMLAGLSYYKEVLKMQKKYNTKGLEIQNTIQTNGTLVDDEWARFFAKNHFLVGLSMDGSRKVNDFCRVDREGESIFKSLMHTIELFEKYGVEFNVVSVVTSLSVEKVPYIYNFFKKKHFNYLQFIPCMDETFEDKNPYSVTPEAYGTFLCELFDLWYEDFMRGAQIDIRMFSNLAQMAAGYMAEECGMSGHCNTYFVVEGDGAVYPCDFYAVDEWRLGTVADGFKTLYDSALSKEFMKGSEILHKKCIQCPYFSLCRGGCRRWRETTGERQGLNYLCPAYEKFFAHCQERILKLGELIKARYQ